MTIDLEVKALQQVPMFRELAPGRLKLLAFTSERVTYSPGEYLFSQGDQADAAFVILDGKAQVILETAADPLVVAELGRNDLVGEMGILTETPRSATVRAETSVIALRIDKRIFLELLQQVPALSIAILREMANRLEKTNIRLAQNGN